MIIPQQLIVLGAITVGALVIDEKTGINAGMLIVLLGAVWKLSSKLSSIDVELKNGSEKFTSFEDFIKESREWRSTVAAQQDHNRFQNEQILRHQEQARQRHEIMMKQMDEVKTARELYAELLRRFEEMKHHINKNNL